MAYRIAEHVKNKGINATVRRTLGADIDGACGQLRAREIEDDTIR
jgi:23S rRNA (adenine2503-C2)-methyltransferase